MCYLWVNGVDKLRLLNMEIKEIKAKHNQQRNNSNSLRGFW